MHYRNYLLLLPLALVGCGKSPDPGPIENVANAPVAEPPQTHAPAREGQAQLPAADPDPKSAEAARAVLVSYTSLLEQGHYSKARLLWTKGGDSGDLDAQLEQFGEFDAHVGDPGPMEGAAGSIYIDVPIELAGRTKSGEPLTLAGSAALRRVNDVPGSTETQRRWHIYGVALQPRP